RDGIVGRERAEVVERVREDLLLAACGHRDRARAEERRGRGREIGIALRQRDPDEAFFRRQKRVEPTPAIARAARLRLEARHQAERNEMTRERAVPARIERRDERALRRELRERELFGGDAERDIAVERRELRL